jgi:RNA polymerase sigma factor (sigma-70 family)
VREEMFHHPQKPGTEPAFRGIDRMKKLLGKQLHKKLLGQILGGFRVISPSPDVSIQRIPIIAAKALQRVVGRRGISSDSRADDAPMRSGEAKAAGLVSRGRTGLHPSCLSPRQKPHNLKSIKPQTATSRSRTSRQCQQSLLPRLLHRLRVCGYGPQLLMGFESNGGGSFPATRWSQVLSARDTGAVHAASALDSLCRVYWPPIYWFVRRQGKPPHEAQDLTQEFFCHLMERDFLNHLRHQNGRFRSFLLAFLKNFLRDTWRREQALKRGGAQRFLSLEELAAEEVEQITSTDTLNADQAYDRRWGLAVMNRAFQRLAAEYNEGGNMRLLEAVKDLAPRERGTVGYNELARDLGMTESALKSAVYRLRQRHQQLLREEIAQTVAHPDEVNDEIRCLIAILAG